MTDSKTIENSQSNNESKENNLFMPIVLLLVSIIVIIATFHEGENEEVIAAEDTQAESSPADRKDIDTQDTSTVVLATAENQGEQPVTIDQAINIEEKTSNTKDTPPLLSEKTTSENSTSTDSAPDNSAVLTDSSNTKEIATIDVVTTGVRPGESEASSELTEVPAPEITTKKALEAQITKPPVVNADPAQTKQDALEQNNTATTPAKQHLHPEQRSPQAYMASNTMRMQNPSPGHLTGTPHAYNPGQIPPYMRQSHAAMPRSKVPQGEWKHQQAQHYSQARNMSPPANRYQPPVYPPAAYPDSGYRNSDYKNRVAVQQQNAAQSYKADRQKRRQAMMQAIEAQKQRNNARIQAQLKYQAQYLAEIKKVQQIALQQAEQERLRNRARMQEINQRFSHLQKEVHKLSRTSDDKGKENSAP